MECERKKKKLLSLSRRLIRKHKVFNVASRTGKRSGYEQEILILAPNRRKGFFVFLYLNFAFYHMSQDLDVVPAIARKKQGKFRTGSIKVSHFRVCNNGSLLQSFLYAFRRGAGPCSQWRGVCNSEVSAGRELIVGVLELRVNSMVKSFPLSFINLPSVNLQLQQ